ncbi:Uma2 family endonuclease, partial [Streptomyces sp. ST2-7A]|uniref:Uma2 family endonuclease n=1 Tax=Streptomyces sp. ST2-7A TaxID=2907214 RepID=UPI001F47935B
HRAQTRDEVLEEGFLALTVPEGFKAELIEGQIVVTPPPDGDHEDIISTLIRQVLAGSSEEMDVSGHKGLLLERADGGAPGNRFVPDATFAPRELRVFRGAPPWMDPTGITMVTEVTSGRPDHDRTTKRLAYARAAIPLYLLIDRRTETLTLHTDPEPRTGDYGHTHTVPFGKPLTLPTPFDFDLDTTDLT